ncbi:uncharacterized protein LOC144100277 [Amblyomma americanum]
MQSLGLLVAVFCLLTLHAATSLKIVGHAIAGSETLEREKFEVSSKADPNDGAQGDIRKLTEKQSVVMFQVKPVQDDYNGNDGDMKALPLSSESGTMTEEAERGDPISDTSKAAQKALGAAVAEFLPSAMSDSHR